MIRIKLRKTIVLPGVLYKRGKLAHSKYSEHRIKGFQNKKLKTSIGKWSEVCNGESHGLFLI